MSDNFNKFGLSRNIEEPIKRRIRQACGFGCACCGLAIVSYEHIDPEFHEAKTHDPERMALLCEGCHSRVTRKFWSKETIKQARANPRCIQDGKCHDAFDIGKNGFVVWIGTNRIINMKTILIFDDTPLLSIYPPEEEGAPYQLSGEFYDKSGNFLCKIVKNEWFGETTNWDIDCKGGRIFIRNQPRQIDLQILCNPPTGIIIEKINMFYKGARFWVDKNFYLNVQSQDKATIRIRGREIKAIDGNCVAFTINSEQRVKELNLAGGTSLGGGGGTFIVESLEYKDFPESICDNLARRRATIGKNEICYCDSGRIFKKCHGKINKH